MSIFVTEFIEGRISYDDFPSSQPNDFVYEFRPGIGVIHETRKFIDYDDIYWGDVEDNPVRKGGSTSAKIKEIADSRRRGVDPSAPLPSVSTCVIESCGKRYFYKAENGFTRYKADKLNGYTTGAMFDVVRFVEEEGYSAEYNRFIWLHQQNDDLPQGVNTVEDMTTSCGSLVAAGVIDKEEFAIRKFVYDSAPNMATSKKNEVVRRVLQQEDVPTKTISWRDGECKDWLETKCVDEVKVDYCFPFHYFQDRLYSVMKQYHYSGDTVAERQVQNIVQHFENKADCEEYILSQRTLQAEKWEEYRKFCWSLAEYMLLNDKQLPINFVGFFPQIVSGPNTDDPNRIVK
jgi:hypothetical protein